LRGEEAEDPAYILRITKEEWVKQVYEKKRYYAGVRRRWRPGQRVLFVHKTEEGDAFIGSAVIDAVLGLEEMSDEDRRLCEQQGWSKLLLLRNLRRFKEALRVRETPLAKRRLPPRALHGMPVTPALLRSILGRLEKPRRR